MLVNLNLSISLLLGLHLLLCSLKSCEAVTVSVKNSCSDSVYAAIAYYSYDTSICQNIVGTNWLGVPICMNYWYNVLPGQTETLASGLTDGCVYLTAYDENDPTYTWPGAPGSCGLASCQINLNNQPCSTGDYDCYSWYQPPSGDATCLTGNYTWELICTNKEKSPSPNYSPSPGLSPSPKPSPPPKSDSGSSNIGVIVGAAVGGVVVVALILGTIFYCMRRKRSKTLSYADSLGKPPPPGTLEQGPLAYAAAVPPTKPEDTLMASYDSNLASYPVQVKVDIHGRDAAALDSGSTVPSAPTASTLTVAGSGSSGAGAATAAGIGAAAIAAAGLPSTSSAEISPQTSSTPSGGTDPLNIIGTSNIWRTSTNQARGPLGAWELNFNDIKLERAIGQGSWGHVYKGNWKETPVAVKILLDNAGGSYSSNLSTGAPPPSTVSNTQTALMPSTSPILLRLEQESSIMTQTIHPNCVQFLGLTLNPAAVVTEFCARGSLCSVLQAAANAPEKAKELTWSRRMSMAADSVRGMIYLHTRNPPIIHRDLKSPNILVTTHWVAKISDFNLSKIMQDATKSTSLQAMNPRWLPPEVLNGESATRESDVFAFGVVLWELLTWQLPWSAANPWSIVSLITSGTRLPIPAPNDLPGAGSGSWPQLDRYIALMQQCWAQDPKDRPSFEQVMVELRNIDPESTKTDI